MGRRPHRRTGRIAQGFGEGQRTGRFRDCPGARRISAWNLLMVQAAAGPARRPASAVVWNAVCSKYGRKPRPEALPRVVVRRLEHRDVRGAVAVCACPLVTSLVTTDGGGARIEAFSC